ncbi:hypothetical protein [Saccharopolyspora sp. ASAGF58]|uniref:hypothetical protein n=1 Tax=Saccharopolyspora sp. ASAGF58 TaxID=2719023 RepID=UPI00144013A6|nr:hypothetical protein [Saccharopolyspora sp. ASAGF58]QIZ35019.1 hypothetical protein FDZ84_10135 [Saccharopolyspora sp. ASAGF58]
MALSPLDGPTGGYRNAPTAAPGVGYESVTPSAWTPPAGGVLSFDRTQLRRAVALFQAAAASARSAAGKAPRVAGQGLSPWGGDPLGSAFGSNYQDPAEQACTALDELSDLLDGVVDRLAAVGRNFAETEAQSVELAQKSQVDGRN